MAVPCTWPRECAAPSVPGLVVALTPSSAALWPRHYAHVHLTRTRTLPWPGHADTPPTASPCPVLPEPPKTGPPPCCCCPRHDVPARGRASAPRRRGQEPALPDPVPPSLPAPAVAP
jgi:hypothetical protein